MMDPKGYETKPWWPYVQNLQEQIDAGGSGGGGGIVRIGVIKNDKNQYITEADPLAVMKAIEDGKELWLEFDLNIFDTHAGEERVSIPVTKYTAYSDGAMISANINYKFMLNTQNNNITLFWAKIDFNVYSDRIMPAQVMTYKEVVTGVN